MDMPEPFDMDKFRDLLQKRRLPRLYIDAIVREVNQHLEDLRIEGMTRGLSPQEAIVAAQQEFGEIPSLADEFAASWRNRPWILRHPVIGFGIIPIVGFSVIFLLCLLLAVVIGNFLGRWHVESTMFSNRLDL